MFPKSFQSRDRIHRHLLPHVFAFTPIRNCSFNLFQSRQFRVNGLKEYGPTVAPATARAIPELPKNIGLALAAIRPADKMELLLYFRVVPSHLFIADLRHVHRGALLL